MKRVPVKGYEGLYEVDDKGNIFGLDRNVNKGKCHRSWEEHPLKYGVDGKGYFRTNLAKDGVNKTVKVHRLVAEAFIPNPLNLPQVNHKDGNKLNNHVNNLEWCSASENMKHSYDSGLHFRKLSSEDVRFILDHYVPRDKEFGTRALGRKFNVSQTAICQVLKKGGDANHV